MDKVTVQAVLTVVVQNLKKAFRSFLLPDLLILDDFGLQRLNTQQSTNLYELIIARHRKSSFVMTSNRAIRARMRGMGNKEWLGHDDKRKESPKGQD